MFDDEVWRSFERLVEVLSREILDADDVDVLSSHEGQGARVQADAMRQAIRRHARGPAAGDMPYEALPAASTGVSRDDQP